MAKPITDVKLEDGLVRVTGWQLFFEGADLIVDADIYGDQRRKCGKSGLRRAIVHGQDDKLILNYDNDYTGGTVIKGNPITAEGDLNCKSVIAEGPIHCGGDMKCKTLSADDIVLQRPKPLGRKKILGDIDETATQVDKNIAQVAQEILNPQSLRQIVDNFYERINKLEDRISVLEARQ